MKEGGSGAAKGRRGRPTASRAASINAQILAAARQLFLDAGFEAVSMEAVAQAAGVSKGTLYARHANKADLLRAMMAERIEAWSQVAGAVDHLLPPDLEGRLRAHAATIYSARHWHETRQMQRLIHSVLTEFPDLAAEWYELSTGSFLRFLAGEIEQAAAHDRLPSVDGTFLANLFLHTLGGWSDAEEMAARNDESDYRAFVNKLIAAVLLVAGAVGGSPTVPAEGQQRS